jgi:hypothetical protein
MTISCTKSSSVENTLETESTDAIRLVQEKLIALQREVDIELKIQEGLDKLVKAKIKVSKKGVLENDIIIQLEKSTKRLDVLKHEIQKRKIQLQTMQLALASILSRECTGNSKSRRHNPNGPPSSEPIIDTGLLRVVVIDPVTKLESKKIVYIKENQSTVEVIETVLNKFNISGAPNNFDLSYAEEKGGLILTSLLIGDKKRLKDEDRPTQIENINYADTQFFLQHREESSRINVSTLANDKLIKKQLEILGEIIDSESKYLEDLKLLESQFYHPLRDSKLFTEAELNDIFLNIHEVITVHEKIASQVDQKSEGHDQMLSKVISSFTDAVRILT